MRALKWLVWMSYGALLLPWLGAEGKASDQQTVDGGANAYFDENAGEHFVPEIEIRDGKKYYRIPRNRFDIQSYEKFLKVYEKDIQGKEEELLEGLKSQERNGDSRCRATATTHDNNNRRVCKGVDPKWSQEAP